MRKIFCVVLLCFIISGCAANKVVIVNPDGTSENARPQKIWWGKAGTSPAEGNTVWKQHDWVLRAQSLDK